MHRRRAQRGSLTAVYPSAINLIKVLYDPFYPCLLSNLASFVLQGYEAAHSGE
jgi:hypothetical protein